MATKKAQPKTVKRSGMPTKSVLHQPVSTGGMLLILAMSLITIATIVLVFRGNFDDRSRAAQTTQATGAQCFSFATAKRMGIKTNKSVSDFPLKCRQRGNGYSVKMFNRKPEYGTGSGGRMTVNTSKGKMFVDPKKLSCEECMKCVTMNGTTVDTLCAVSGVAQ